MTGTVAPSVVPSEAFNQQQRALAGSMLRAGAKELTVVTALKEAAKKCYDCDYDDDYCYSAWLPYGGATSFADIDAYEQAAAAEQEVWEISYQFERICDNIFSDDSIDLAAKAAKVQAAATELTARMKADVPAAMESALSEKETHGPLARMKSLLGLGGEKDRTQIHPATLDPAAASAAQPAPEPRSAFKAFKQADGSWRWLAVHSNSFRDVENEVFPLDANKAWEARVDAGTAPMPEAWLWHTPGTAFGKADMVTVDDNGFCLSSGTFYAGKEALAQALADYPDELGVSHGFSYDEKDRTDGEVRAFNTFEVSPLPMWAAANKITGFAAGKELDMTIKPEKRAFLATVLGSEDAVKALESTLQTAAKNAHEKGIDFKDVESAIGELAVPTAPAVVPPVIVTTEAAPDLLQTLQAALQPFADRLSSMEATVNSVKEQTAALSVSRDESVAALMAGRNDPARAGFVASESGPVARAGSADVKAAELGAGSNIPAHLKDQLALAGVTALAVPAGLAG